MREASRNRQSQNDVRCTYKLTRLLQFIGWNKYTNLHSIHNGNLEIVIRVGYMPPPLIFSTSNDVISSLPQWYRLNVLCASTGLYAERTEGPWCIRPPNIGRTCGMPLLQIQTCCPLPVSNFHDRFNAVLSRYTPIIAI